MANIKISQLTAAAAASDTQEFEVNDSLASKKVTGAQVKAYVKSGFAASDITGLTASATELNVLDNIATNGLVARTGSGTGAARTITGTSNQITVTNGDGASGNPTIAAVIASQAEAEAGTDTTKLMTPQRVSQAVAALGSNNLVLLGTLSANGVTTRTLSGLTLTSYAALFLIVDNVSHDAGANRSLFFGTATLNLSASIGAAGAFSGFSVVTLGSGVSASFVASSGSTPSSMNFGATGYTTATTSVSFTWNGTGNFDAGTIKVYGIKA